MATNEIKVFFSWQSDLPSNQTRSVIQDGINAAVKSLRDTIEIIADRDTKGVLGTPDISETIFSKINKSDLFVADISIINKYSTFEDDGSLSKDMKLSPNPNVLLELGYAASVLGWDHVICIMNTDYGAVSELPFDLAHRRPYQFSLQEKEKTTVKKEIKNIIMEAVSDIIENGTRAKPGFSNLLLGSVSFEKNAVSTRTLFASPVRQLPGYKNQKEKLIHECENLFNRICLLNIMDPDESDYSCDSKKEKDDKEETVEDYINKMKSPYPVTISSDERKFFEEDVRDYLGVELPKTIFSFGALHKKTSLYDKSMDLLGTEAEKEKYHLFYELSYKLKQLRLLEIFVDTFNDLYILPLFVINDSSITDEEITVTIHIEHGLPIIPSKNLFNPEYSSKEAIGLEGFVFEAGFMKEVLLLPEDQYIQYDSDISYSFQDSIRDSEKNAKAYLSGSSPEATTDDYEYELRKYIAVVKDRTKADYEYDISMLRPQEKKWLGAFILVKPEVDGCIELSYVIKSKRSSCIMEGFLAS